MKARFFPVIDSLHIIAYFESPPLSLSRLVNHCLSLLSLILGDRQICIETISESISSKIEKQKHTAKLGQVIATLDELEPQSSSIRVSCPAPSANRYQEFGIRESIVCLDYYDYQVSHGTRLGPSFCITVNLDWLDNDQQCLLNREVARFANLLTETPGFCYGFCEIADVRETVLGTFYSTAFSNLPNFQRRLARVVWEKEGGLRARKARGVYWGNILSADMLNDIGGVEWLAEFASIDNPRKELLCHELANGAYLVLICSDMGELRDRSLTTWKGTYERAAVLYRRLFSVGLLCGNDSP
jgi:hypothetical protein